MIASMFFFLFSQLGVGMMLTLSVPLTAQNRKWLLQVRQPDGRHSDGRDARL